MPFIEHNGARVLFIHIPKAGGTTIETWLAEHGPLNLMNHGVPSFSKCTPQHYRLRDIRTIFHRGFFDYIFTVVRNPYDRIASEYRMRAALQGESFFKVGPSFSQWLETALKAQSQNAFYLDNHIRPQWEFIGSGVEVFRIEDGLEQALAHVASILGAPQPANLPRELATQDAGISVEWDLADRLAVQEHYDRDFSQFGYSVDPG